MIDRHDPKGLIRESFRIEAISDAECRSILIDWALSLPDGVDQRAALGALLAQYGAGDPEHPMTRLMEQGLAPPARQGRSRKRAR
ncbi:MAG: hypothetical protein JJT99_06855 [Rhodobacteraceae bacterium]|nr:hypothetical protein [Paracoccaceae bacterium]